MSAPIMRPLDVDRQLTTNTLAQQEISGFENVRSYVDIRQRSGDEGVVAETVGKTAKRISRYIIGYFDHIKAFYLEIILIVIFIIIILFYDFFINLSFVHDRRRGTIDLKMHQYQITRIQTLEIFE